MKLAKAGHARIFDSCCRAGKKHECEFISRCGWIRQFAGDPPNVWVAAHELLYHDQEMFGDKLIGVCLDESFWQSGLFGIGDDEQKWTINIDKIARSPVSKAHRSRCPANSMLCVRSSGRVLQRQPGPGGSADSIWARRLTTSMSARPFTPTTVGAPCIWNARTCRSFR